MGLSPFNYVLVMDTAHWRVESTDDEIPETEGLPEVRNDEVPAGKPLGNAHDSDVIPDDTPILDAQMDPHAWENEHG